MFSGRYVLGEVEEKVGYVSAGESLLGRTEVKAVDVWSVEEPLSSMPSQPCPLVETNGVIHRMPSELALNKKTLLYSSAGWV
ncbi:hypothetical protein Cadr_000012357 [Camelus dromedarius]|uniref:Uncharacterized protein n=1 Tax=Camelus dromedarius TaxID=9838 RepID=A0A5N4DR26_CAMDR|nr:hypothetical protein Cadr_000012357 [Camelus dromedarius]